MLRNSLVNTTQFGRTPVLAAGIFCACGYAWLALLSRGYADVGLSPVLIVCVGSSLVSMVLARMSRVGSLELRISDVLWFALAFRLIGLCGYPLLEDDHFRYLWDGWVFAELGSPYDIAPAEFFTDERIVDELTNVLDSVNYPDVPTVYGPTAQWLFAFSYFLAPAAVWPLQIFSIVADFVIILCLLRWAPLAWVLLYAWSGLVLKEFAFTAHIDVWGAAFLCAAIALQQSIVRQSEMSDRTQNRVNTLFKIGIGILLGLAVGIKVFCVIALPFVLGKDRLAWTSMLSTCCAIAWPFGLVAAWYPAGLVAMGESWLFNAPLYVGSVAVFGAQTLPITKVGLFFLYACIYLVVLYRSLFKHGLRSSNVAPAEYASSLGWLFGLLFLLSPVFNPWYMVWWLFLAVPFKHQRLMLTPWVASVVLFASYFTGINTDWSNLHLYEVAPGAMWVEFGLITLALVLDGWRKMTLAKINALASL